MSEKQTDSDQKLPLGIALKRALKLRCPLCGQGKMFKGIFRMNERCEDCDLKYEEEPGYFLGATYINYALTIVIVSVSYLVLHFLVGIRRLPLSIGCGIFIVLFSLFFFRYARSFWLAIDKWLVSIGTQNLPGEND